MANFDSLPNELIAMIFGSLPTLHSAASLCATNRRHHEIWTQGTEQFATEILTSKIVAYEPAVDLARAEERLEGNAAASADEQPAFQIYVRRLLRNAELAESAAIAWAAWLSDRPKDDYRRRLTLTCSYAPYYFLRKLVLAYRHPEAQLQKSLLVSLRTSELDVLRTHDEIYTFVAAYAGEEERTKHGVPMPEEDWTHADEYEYIVNLPE